MNFHPGHTKIFAMTAAFLFVTIVAAAAATTMVEANKSEMSPMVTAIIETMAAAAQNMQ